MEGGLSPNLIHGALVKTPLNDPIWGCANKTNIKKIADVFNDTLKGI